MHHRRIWAFGDRDLQTIRQGRTLQLGQLQRRWTAKLGQLAAIGAALGCHIVRNRMHFERERTAR